LIEQFTQFKVLAEIYPLFYQMAMVWLKMFMKKYRHIAPKPDIII